MIPRRIHYCWYGGKKKPQLVTRCMESWKRFCPDYEIICWDEENTDFRYNEYLWEAYQKKKWAFVTDVVRLMAVYQSGGIYLDTDVELLKPLDPLLMDQAFLAKETQERVATGLGFGAEARHWVTDLLLQDYNKAHFLLENGQLDQTACPKRITRVLKEIGLKDGCDIQNIGGCLIYQPEYFCPKQYDSKVVNLTEHTYSIHHYHGSWIPFELKVKRLVAKRLGKPGIRMIKVYNKIRWGK